jgi:membrane protease YdiL (CAAX protease family)
MSATKVLAPHLTADRTVATPFDRSQLPQYSLVQILGLWAAAAVPMSLLAWVVAPWLADRLGGREPLGGALLICFNAGLTWILVSTLIPIRREQGSLEWPRVRDALWLRAPQDPKTGRIGGKVWWWLRPFALLAAALEALPINPEGPLPRDFPNFTGTDRAEHFFHGAWDWFALAVLVAVLAPTVEELFFRGLLLRRMRAAFGKGDRVANGTMFTAYHPHEPWVMPTTLLTGVFTQAYRAKPFQSIRISVVAHTLPSLLIIRRRPEPRPVTATWQRNDG